jgi:hypothetical protein
MKNESDFAKDVFYYLVRRYPTTKIIDYGGLSSDPIIESHNAGPFRSLEVKVITNKQEGVTDRDLILRGVLDKERFRQSGNERLNMLVSPQITWNDPTSRVKLGNPLFDRRFMISADNSIFVRHLLRETDLGEMLLKNYDLEAYSLYWYQDSSTVIQIRMESMTSNSFLKAYNMALATVGILNQKGYLIKSEGIQENTKKIVQTWSSVNPPIHKPDYSTKQDIQTSQSEDTLYRLKELPKIKLHPERDLRKLEEKQTQRNIQRKPSFQEKQAFPAKYEETDPPKTHVVKGPNESSSLVTLFTSIRYQAKNINYLASTVEVETFSSQLPRVLVTFPSFDKALLQGSAIQIPKQPFNLQINNSHSANTPSWDKPWKDIEITGTQYIQDQIKRRTAIGNQIKETGRTKIEVEGSEKGIVYSISISKSKEGIASGYSLLLDLVWFFEMLV